MCCIELMLSVIFAGNLFPFSVRVYILSFHLHRFRASYRAMRVHTAQSSFKRLNERNITICKTLPRKSDHKCFSITSHANRVRLCMCTSGCVPSALKLWLIHCAKVATTTEYRILSTSASHTHKRIRIYALHTFVQYAHDLPNPIDANGK